MLENLGKIFKKIVKTETTEDGDSKEAAKERLQLVLMQDRANVSADFLELMKQEIVDVIKKYIEVDETAIDVRLTTKINDDGSNGAPILYANIPILNIKNDIVGSSSTEVHTNSEVQSESDDFNINLDDLEDENDDDITFDDLLKAAEEAEAKKSDDESEEGNAE